MYENILLAYDCEEKFETAVKELNNLISNKRNDAKEEDTLITVLVIIPQQLKNLSLNKINILKKSLWKKKGNSNLFLKI
mgnify:CR=1 FL=1